MPVKCLLIVLSSNSSVAVVEDITKDTLQAATLFKQSLRTITCIAGHSSTNSGKKVSNCLKTGHSNRLSTDSTDSFLKFFSKVFLSHRRITGVFLQPRNDVSKRASGKLPPSDGSALWLPSCRSRLKCCRLRTVREEKEALRTFRPLQAVLAWQQFSSLRNWRCR